MNLCFYRVVEEDIRPAILDLVPAPQLGGYIITRINVPAAARQKGHAQSMLSEALAQADSEGITLLLAPEPSDGMPYEPLVRWYFRNGFKWTRSGAMMERIPLLANVARE